MLAALLALAVQTDRPIDPLVLVPEDALIVISLTDMDELRARAAQNDWVRLANDPSFAPLLELLEEQTRDSADSPSLRSWWNALHGSLAAFAVGDLDSESALFGAFIEVRGDRGPLDALVHDSFADSVAESGVDHSGVGVRIHREGGSSADDSPRFLFSFECAGWLGLVADHDRERALDLVLGAIDRALGKDGARGFAANGGLERARASVDHERAFEMFYDFGRFARRAFEKRSEHDRKVVRRLGLLDGWIYAAADVGKGEDFDCTLSLGFDPAGMLAGLDHVLGPLPVELFPVAPPDSLSVSLGSIDVAGLWKAISAAAKELDETSYAQMTHGLEQMKTVSGIDVEEDVLQRIRGSFLMFTTHAPASELAEAELDPDAGDVEKEEVDLAVAREQEIGTSLVVALDEASDLEDLVDSLLAKFGLDAADSTAEFRGHTIHSPATGFHWGFTDEAFVFGSALTPLHTLIERLEDPGARSSAKDARFHAALERNRDAGSLSIADTAQGFETMLTYARVVLDLGARGASDEEDAALARRIQAALPDGSAAQEYLDGVIASALVSAPDHLALRISGR